MGVVPIVFIFYLESCMYRSVGLKCFETNLKHFMQAIPNGNNGFSVTPKPWHFGFSWLFIITIVNPYSVSDLPFFMFVFLTSELFSVVEGTSGGRWMKILFLHYYSVA